MRNQRSRPRAASIAGRLLATVALALACLLALAVPASAHPLGNFTINHYNGIRISVDAAIVDHVTDFAEIPTFQERGRMDVDGDLAVSESEAAGYRRSRCSDLAADLELRQDERRLDLRPIETGISFPQGQAAPTARLVCVYRAALAVQLGGLTTFTFEDRSHPERVGWREIVVEGDGATVTATDSLEATVSERLTTYPSGLLQQPVDQSAATWTVAPGGPALPAFDAPDAEPIGGAATPGLGGPAGTDPGPTATEPGATTPDPIAEIPGGVSELGGELGALFQTRDLTLPLVLLSVVLAAGLGALHALSPGHGKTVMAAYLVGSRGSVRHAIGLGLTVTVSHTLGVLALGVLSLSAASFLPPERLYPVLGLISGAIVIVIGVYLVGARVRDALRSRAASRAHALAQDWGHDHRHDHRHGTDDGPDHEGREHAAPEGDDHASDGAAGWHDHGGRRHRHVPLGDGPLSWRGLFALGLAGGMVPSVSALILLLGSISLGRPAYGILLTVAFGLGMALVLVGIGVALVYARGLLERMPVRSSGARLARLLPAATAVVVLGAGLVITGQALLTI